MEQQPGKRAAEGMEQLVLWGHGGVAAAAQPCSAGSCSAGMQESWEPCAASWPGVQQCRLWTEIPCGSALPGFPRLTVRLVPLLWLALLSPNAWENEIVLELRGSCCAGISKLLVCVQPIGTAGSRHSVHWVSAPVRVWIQQHLFLQSPKWLNMKSNRLMFTLMSSNYNRMLHLNLFLFPTQKHHWHKTAQVLG